jgi:hypothetical protein
VEAHQVALRVRGTFADWDPEINEFDPQVAEQLRAEATSMFNAAAKATGATADVLSAEAKALAAMSVAIEIEDESALVEAATEADTNLAGLRGVCNF